ncbi:MAG TPA: FecR domain-containing protein [Chitinophagaceae bacterium]
MDKNYFIKLLHKYLDGNLTNEEQRFLISYYNLFQNEPDVMEVLNIEEKEELKNDIKSAIWNHISEEEQAVSKIKFINKRFVKLAAAAVVFIMFLASVFILFNRPSENPQPEPLAVHKKENRVIFLPDGSTVILSAGSKLNYPSSFDGLEKREVFLDGQAFFDIKHNASRPFIVYTGKLKTEVLGTAFDIKAIPGEADITVTVTRGKVKIMDQDKVLGVITPNQQITYSKQKVSAVTKTINIDSLLNWKEQDLRCDNLTVAEAAELLEGRYHVKIIISDQSITSQRFTTIFSKNDSFEQVLKSICVFNGLSYEYNKQNSVVTISHK